MATTQRVRLAFAVLMARLRERSVTQLLFDGFSLLGLIALELVGRQFPSDLYDPFALLLIGLALLWLPVPTLGVVGLLKPIIGRVWRHVKSWGVEFGVDFKRTPAIPRGTPPRWLGLLACCTLMVPWQLYAARFFPNGVRLGLISVSYLVYLAVVGLLWMTICLGALLELSICWHALLEAFEQRRPGQKPKFAVPIFIGSLVIVSGGALLLPLWIPLALQGLTLIVISAGCVGSSAGLEIVWKDLSGSPLRSMDGCWFTWITSVLLMLGAASLALLTAGDTLFVGVWAQSGTSAPLTSLAGGLFAWLTAAFDIVLAIRIVRFTTLGIRFNPRRLQRRLGSTVQPPRQNAAAYRRSEILNRRELVRRLRAMFQFAGRQRRGAKVRPIGYWLGLQHWFLLGLWAEFDGEAPVGLDQIIGRPFHHIFNPETRYHYWLITSALQVDLIFVESGVPFRRVVLVLRMMFEIYDIHGGRQRAEEWHFSGLPTIRVLIHDFDMQNAPSHGHEKYPEPDYEELGRARILHICKDRGGDMAEFPSPTTYTDRPELVGV